MKLRTLTISLVWLLIVPIFKANATILPQNTVLQPIDTARLANIKPFDKIAKISLITGAIALPIGLLIEPIGGKAALVFLEFLGLIIGTAGLLLLAFGLFWWLGRWLVRRHIRLPEKKRKRQWWLYLASLIGCVLLGFLLILGV